MKIVGLTGGIGSGKSTVAKILESKGYPIYNSDLRAKEIMNESLVIKNELINTYGSEVYKDNELNRPFLAEIVFNDQEKLNSLNNLVHPEVFKDFEDWKKQQNAPIGIKEAAILFESGSYKNCDLVVTVSAPEEIRILRSIERDNASKEDVESRISKQWNDEQKEALADYIIRNDGNFIELEKQVEQFHFWLQNNPFNSK